MPNIKRLSISRTHFAGNTVGLITVIGPSFLIAKNFIILSSTLRKNLFILDSLFTNIGKHRPIVVKTRLTRPMTFNALLISMIVTSNHHTNNIAMLRKRLHKVRIGISSLRHTNYSTLRSIGTGTSTRLLNNLININRNTIAAEILGTLQTGIRRGHAKMRLKHLNITSTTTSITLIEFLNLESETELINRCNNGITRRNSPKVRRLNRSRNSTRRRTLNQLTISTKSNCITVTGPLPSRTRNTGRKTDRISRNKNGRRNIRILRNDRHISLLRNGKRYIGTFLRGRKTTREVIVILSSDIRLTTFRNIGNEGTAIRTGYGSIINGNNKRVLQILITEPLIHHKGIGPEGESGNRNTSNAGR